MSVTCTSCHYDNNPIGTEFCEACGVELTPPPLIEKAITSNSSLIPVTPTSETLPEVTPIVPFTPITPLAPTFAPEPAKLESAPPARLVAKQVNAPQLEFPLTQIALVGIFDVESGPVDIDLEAFLGGETVSRHHAEVYPEAGNWLIKDLGSTNGVFIKPNGQARFAARITTPTVLHSGDELAFGKVQFIFQII
jgi:hypothetical protein